MVDTVVFLRVGRGTKGPSEDRSPVHFFVLHILFTNTFLVYLFFEYVACLLYDRS
jgi:hypothetical protein